MGDDGWGDDARRDVVDVAGDNDTKFDVVVVDTAVSIIVDLIVEAESVSTLDRGGDCLRLRTWLSELDRRRTSCGGSAGDVDADDDDDDVVVVELSIKKTDVGKINR